MLKARIQSTIQTTLAISCLTAALTFPGNVKAAAGGIQNCVAGSTCTIGEFLYDDNSAPISGATCVINSKYPDLSAHLSSQALTSGSDGWYYYSFTAPVTTGMYPTTISCTVSGDTLSIDKSFQVDTASSTDPSAVASAVWGYSTRTVSSFGNLVSDIWDNATRSLTTSSSTTTNITNTTDNSIVATINSIKSTADKTRLLLEQVVNKPIIQNVLVDTAPPISEKLEGTKTVANQLYVNNQFLTARSATLVSKWNSTSGEDLLGSVIALSDVLGASTDTTSSNTMFGQVNWVRNSWNWDESSAIYDQLVMVDKSISDLKVGLVNYKKTPALYAEAKKLVKYSVALEKVIGSTSDGSVGGRTLYSKINKTGELSLNLDSKGSEVNRLISEFAKSGDVAKITPQIKALQNQIIALNKVTGATNTLTKINPVDPNSVRNLLLGLRGIVDSNSKLLSLGAGKTLVNTWLEIGSIVFKTLATNPSTLVSQNVEIKYYLPKEIRQEDIMKTDEGLSVNYDSDKDQLYVEGTVSLAPGQTKTFSVETKDIWQITSAEIQSIKDQTNTLISPLEGTAYFAQGTTLKSDINASMDQIALLYSEATTPEEKIQAYRQAKILMDSANSNLVALKDLVTQVSASGSLLGFVGGSQTISVWGIVAVVVAGFILLTVYMKSAAKKSKDEDIEPPKLDFGMRVRPSILIAVALVSSVIGAGASGFIVNRIVSVNYEKELSILGAQTTAPSPTPTPVPEVVVEPIIDESQSDLGTGGQYIVVVGETPTGLLNVRNAPGGAKIVFQVKTGDKLIYVDENIKYYQVQLESGDIGWVSKEFSNKE